MLSVTTTAATSSVAVTATLKGKMVEGSLSFDCGVVPCSSKPSYNSHIRVVVDSNHLGSTYVPK